MATNKGKINSINKVEVSEIHGDLSQQIIQITVDKLSLILYKHSVTIENKKAWIAPLGIFITIVIVLATSNFKEFIWSAEIWCAIFIICGGLSFLWLVKSSWLAYKSESIEELVDIIKKQD